MADREISLKKTTGKFKDYQTSIATVREQSQQLPTSQTHLFYLMNLLIFQFTLPLKTRLILVTG
jgi:hypothetical protein